MAYASLSIDLRAQLAHLQSGMDKAVRLAEKDAARMERAFAQVKAVAGGIGGALVAGLSVSAVTTFIQSTNDALLAIKDLAEGTGSTIEQISALENAMRANNRQLAEAQPILVKFNGALKEADGKNGISQALQAIGLDAKELRKLDPVEALQQVGKALQTYSDDANKARLVQELFGKSVAEVIPFLNDLAEAQLQATEGIREATEEADKFEKNLAKLQSRATDLARTLAGPVVSGINKMFDAFRGGPSADLELTRRQITLLTRYINENGSSSALPQMVMRLKELRDLEQKLAGELGPAGRRPANEGGGGLATLRSIPDLTGKGGGKAGKADTPGAITDPANQQLQNFLRSEKAVYEQIERDAAAARESVQRLLEDTDIAKIAKLQVELQSLLDFQSVNGETPALTEKVMQLRLEIDKLNAERLVPKVDIKSDFLRSEKGQYEQTEEFMRGLKTEAKSLDNVVNDLGLSFSSAFEDAIVNGQNLRDVIQGLGQDILRILSREFVTKPLGDALIKILRGGQGGGTTGGGLGDLIGSILGGLPSFAVGTDYVPRDMVAKIHAGERIVPAAENRRGRSGVVNNIIVQTLPGTRAETSESENSSGGIDTIVKMVDERMAAGVMSGHSKTARAFQGTYGLSRATGAPRKG